MVGGGGWTCVYVHVCVLTNHVPKSTTESIAPNTADSRCRSSGGCPVHKRLIDSPKCLQITTGWLRPRPIRRTSALAATVRGAQHGSSRGTRGSPLDRVWWWADCEYTHYSNVNLVARISLSCRRLWQLKIDWSLSRLICAKPEVFGHIPWFLEHLFIHPIHTWFYNFRPMSFSQVTRSRQVS